MIQMKTMEADGIHQNLKRRCSMPSKKEQIVKLPTEGYQKVKMWKCRNAEIC